MAPRRRRPGPRPRPAGERLSVLLGVRLQPDEMERLRARSAPRAAATVVRDLIRDYLEGGAPRARLAQEAERVREDRSRLETMLFEIRSLRERTRAEIDRLRADDGNGKD